MYLLQCLNQGVPSAGRYIYDGSYIHEAVPRWKQIMPLPEQAVKAFLGMGPEETLHGYLNKAFTVFGYTHGGASFAVYKHDFVWYLYRCDVTAPAQKWHRRATRRDEEVSQAYPWE